MQAFLFEMLGADPPSTPEGAAHLRARGAPAARPASGSAMPELGDLLERLGAEGPGFLYDGDVARAVSDWVLERGGLLITARTWPSYAVVEREPARARYHGREVLTNPPPSSGGILIAYSLELLERLDRPGDTATLAEVMAGPTARATHDFLEGLHTEGYLERFLAPEALDRGGGRDRLAARLDHAPLGDGRERRVRHASRARTARARAWWCPAPACTSTTCSARRT